MFQEAAPGGFLLGTRPGRTAINRQAIACWLPTRRPRMRTLRVLNRAQAASPLMFRRLGYATVARGDPGASRHALLFGLDAPPSSCCPWGTRLRSLTGRRLTMNDEHLMELDLELELDFDMEAFEQDLIEEYGSLEAAYIDMSDRPE